MSKLVKRIIVTFCVFTMLIASVVPVVGWFFGTNSELSSLDSSATVIAQYFHCGTGTAEDPFVITRPIHYYHLVELYQRTDGFAASNYYFRVGYDLDGNSKNGLEVYSYDEYGQTDGTYSKSLNMAYYSGDRSLIPIGTPSHPFNGHFDGSGLTIENLTIVSYETIGSNTYGSSDIGVFGSVVNANMNGSTSGCLIHDVYFTNLTISLEGATAEYDTYTQPAKYQATVHADDSSVHQSGNICIGYIIGHVYNYNIAVGLDYTRGTVAEASSPISNVYVNNISMLGGTSNNAVCEYGLIGHIENMNGENARSIQQKIDDTIGSSAGTGDQGWGGSVDMYSLYNRVSTIFETYDSSAYRYYPTAETVLKPANDSEYPVTTITAKSSGNFYSSYTYWSAAAVAGQGVGANTTGGALFGDIASGQWNYLYSLSSSQTTAVTTTSKSGATVTAYYIFDNGYYLGYDGTNVFGATASKNAAKLIPTDDTPSGDGSITTTYRMLINEREYYLQIDFSNVNSRTVKFTSDSASASTFTRTGDGEFYYKDTGHTPSINYYLNYTGNWEMSESASRTAITDGEGHYLSATTEGIINETNADNAYIWQVSSNGSSKSFYFVSGGTNYYLTYGDSKLIVSTTPTSWTVTTEGDKQKLTITAAGIDYCLIYDNGWKAAMLNGFKIKNGTHYLKMTLSGAEDATESDATMFQFSGSSGSYSISCAVNSTKYYLTSVGDLIRLSTSATTWQTTGNETNGFTAIKRTLSGYSVNIFNTDYVIVYRGGWRMEPLSGVTISATVGGATHYLTLDENGKIADTVNADSARIFNLINDKSMPIGTFYNGNTVYVCPTETGTELGVGGKFSWNRDGVRFYIHLGNSLLSTATGTSCVDRLYLSYFDDTGTWGIWDAIFNNNGRVTGYDLHFCDTTETHFMCYNDNNVIVDGTLADAPSWFTIPTGNSAANGDAEYVIYIYRAKTKYYLTVEEGKLALTTSQTKWHKRTLSGSDAYYFDNGYFLSYENGWTLVELSSFAAIYYQDGDTKRYLYTGGSGVSAITEALNASEWSFNTGSGTITTNVGAQKYYLTYEVKEIKTYGGGENPTVTSAKRVISPTVSTTQPSAKWTWSASYDSYSISIGGVPFYLYYDTATGDWALEETGCYHIKNMITPVDCNYYVVTDTPNDLTASPITYSPILSVESQEPRAGWHIENASGGVNIFCFIGDQKYYITHGTDSTAALPVSLTFTAPSTAMFFLNSKSINCYCDSTLFNFANAYMDPAWDYEPISDGTHFLVVDPGDNFSSASKVTISARTSTGRRFEYYQFIPTSENQQTGFTIQRIINGTLTTLYLTSDASGNLSFTSTKSLWYRDGASYYQVKSGINYYLTYQGNKWMASPSLYFTVNYSGNYMIAASTTAIGSTTTNGDNCRWFSADGTADSRRIYTFYNGNAYYLKYDSATGFSLTNLSNATYFTVSGGTNKTLKVTPQGLGVSLDVVYDSTGWNVAMSTGYTISFYTRALFDSENTYLYATTTSVSANTSTSTTWYVSAGLENSGYMFMTSGGVVSYLTLTGTSLAMTKTYPGASGAPLGTWVLESNGIKVLSGTAYYEVYFKSTGAFDATAKIAVEQIGYQYAISTEYSGSTKYMYMTESSGQSGSSASYGSSSSAKTWYFSLENGGKIYYKISSSSKYYLSTASNSSLSYTTTSESSADSWTYDSSTKYLYTTVSSTKRYLRYSGSSWTCTNKENQATQITLTPQSSYSGDMTLGNVSAGTTTVTEAGYTPTEIARTMRMAIISTYDLGDQVASVYDAYRPETTAVTARNSVNLSSTIPNYETRAERASKTGGGGTTATKYTPLPTPVSLPATSTNPTVTVVKTSDTLYVTVGPVTKRRGTYLALRTATDDSGSEYSDLRAAIKNTGYIVGGTNSAASGSGIGDIRISEYSRSNISDSFSFSTGKFTTVYTFNDSGSSPVAIGTANNYTEFERTKSEFAQILAAHSDGVYGLHFMDAAISASRTIEAESVMILGKTYVNYELPESSIDFNVAEQGTIVLYAGDYYGGNSCFFSLHRIFRDADNAITDTKEIVEVYSKPSMKSYEYYIYKFSDGTYTNANGTYTGATTLNSAYTVTAFKMKWLTNPTGGRSFSNDYVYYFEIPCNKGEYALGSVSGQDGGYLLYLDIAANGAHGSSFNQDAGISSEPLFTETGYLSSGKQLNNVINIAYTIPANNTADNFNITLNYDPTATVHDDRYDVDCHIYDIVINNSTGNPMELYVLLVDDDDDPENSFNYRYRIKYNGEWYSESGAYDSVTGLFFATSTVLLPEV